MKLSGWVWLWVGFCLSVIVLSYAFFQYVQPNDTDTELITKNAELYKPLASEQTKKAAIKRVEKANKLVADSAAKWQAIVAEKTPPRDVNAGGIDLRVSRLQLTLDVPKFRNSVQIAVNNQLKKGGVKVINGAFVPLAPVEPGQIVESYFNWPAYPFPVCFFNFGTITVTGTYEQITNHVRAWSNMPNYLAVADGLKLSGTSPKLTGTYNLAVVALIRGDEISPPIAGNAAADPAAGGGGGAPAGGAGGRGPVNRPPGAGGGGGRDAGGD